MDKIAVLMGKEVLGVVPGRVSTEVDARYGFLCFPFTTTHCLFSFFLFSFAHLNAIFPVMLDNDLFFITYYTLLINLY